MSDVAADWEKFAQATQRFVKAYGESITEKFKPFSEAAARMQEQERKRRQVKRPLELSNVEHVAVRNALSTAKARGYNYNATIDLILEDINRVRAGGEPG